MKRLLVVSLALFAGAVHAELKVTGTYTSLRFGTEDLSGAEITIVYGGSGYYVIAQCAEGAPGIPEVAPATVEGNKITFKLKDESASGCPDSTYRGIVSEKGLKGTFEGLSEWPGMLKRGKSYWQ